MRNEASDWLKNEGVYTGYIFKNRYGKVISARGISQQLKHFAIEYGIDPKVVYPHSFRYADFFIMPIFGERNLMFSILAS